MTQNKQLTILIADDHPIFRKGLRDIVEQLEGVTVVAEVGDGATALERAMSHRPDIAILDIQMPGMSGLEVARRMQAEKSPSLVIILTMYDDEEVFNRAMEYGVMGYLLKDSAVVHIVEALRRVGHGEYYISPALSDRLMRNARADTGTPDPMIGLDLLTPSERRVLRMISENRSTRQIAEELNISARTVEHHRSHICAKLNLYGSFSLLRFAIENKLRL